MHDFQKSLAQDHQRRLQRLLKHRATGHVRWTLPAIVLQDMDGKERILALPTLDVSIPDIDGVVKWEIRYKKVHTAGLPIYELSE